MKNIFGYLLIALTCLVTSCAVFEEKPVTNSTVNILVPGDMTTITSLNMTFLWSEVQSDNPVKYNIQVVSPNFTNPSFFVIDTNTAKTKYTKTLIPGIYQCRVNVFNGSTKSQYSTTSFVVDTSNYVQGVMTLLTPADSLKTKNLNVTFSWNVIKYATQYNIQVFSIDSATGKVGTVIVTDTNTTLTKNTVRLPGKGIYKWQVRAFNNVSTTDFTSRIIMADTTNGISGQTVILSSPSDNVYLNKKAQLFEWQTIPYASNYKLEIAINNFNSSSNVFYSNTTVNDTMTALILTDGTYQWRVTAANSAGSSNTSAARTINILTKTPSMPSLLNPTDNFTTSSSIVSFGWSKDVSTTDSLIVYGADSTTIVKQIGKSSASAVNDYSDSFSTGKYFWKVKSTDLAGNVGLYSIRKKFFVP